MDPSGWFFTCDKILLLCEYVSSEKKMKENFKFTPFLVKFKPFLRTSTNYMQIKFKCVYPTPPDVHLT